MSEPSATIRRGWICVQCDQWALPSASHYCPKPPNDTVWICERCATEVIIGSGPRSVNELCPGCGSPVQCATNGQGDYIVLLTRIAVALEKIADNMERELRDRGILR